MDIFKFTVPPGASDLRLDQLIASELEGFSRTLAREVIDLGGVHVNGRRTSKCEMIPPQGARIELYRDDQSLEPFKLRDDHILYRDPYLLALNKPAGVDTQPTHARYRGTIYEALIGYLQNPLRPDLSPELGMVQRLDRGTSGVLVFSTHTLSHRPMSEAFVGRKIRKCYLALVQGSLPAETGEICSHLVRSRNGNRMMSVNRGGREAITRYRMLASHEGVSLVAVEILTGRTHQVRVHMAEQGCPLLGDSYYGGVDNWEGGPMLRPMLHAFHLAFEHPVSAEPLALSAPVPDDMAFLVERLIPGASSLLHLESFDSFQKDY